MNPEIRVMRMMITILLLVLAFYQHRTEMVGNKGAHPVNPDLLLIR
jgi:hypothetical protein